MRKLTTLAYDYAPRTRALYEQDQRRPEPTPWFVWLFLALCVLYFGHGLIEYMGYLRLRY